MPLRTQSTPSGRPSQPWTSSTPWRDKAEPCTDSEVSQLPTSNTLHKTALFRATHIFREIVPYKLAKTSPLTIMLSPMVTFATVLLCLVEYSRIFNSSEHGIFIQTPVPYVVLCIRILSWYGCVYGVDFMDVTFATVLLYIIKCTHTNLQVIKVRSYIHTPVPYVVLCVRLHILPGSILAYEYQVVHVSILIGVFWVK